MKRLFIALTVIVGVVVLVALIGFFTVGFYLSPQDHLAKSDVVVAISGGETATRTQEAVRLYKDGWAKHIIFSGAALDPTSPSNARIMAADAIKSGVPADAIELDETSVNTRQNASDATTIMMRAGYHSMILVTSPYHQRRADLAFRHVLGSSFTIINHSSYDQNWRRSHWWATSYSRSLTVSELQKVIYELASGGKS